MRALGAPLGFIAKRAAEALFVMLAIAVIAFAVKRALGDPLREIMGEAVPEAEREELRHQARSRCAVAGAACQLSR